MEKENFIELPQEEQWKEFQSLFNKCSDYYCASWKECDKRGRPDPQCVDEYFE